MSTQRDDIFDALSKNTHFDVVVVGGGINGIGVYRELALQGLRVLLVERNDYCSGCSSAPSRMIHGGLRYLENGEFGLVQESLKERDALLRNAPHFVKPLPTTIPINSLFSGSFNAAMSFLRITDKPANRGALPIKMGLSFYDWITRKKRTLPKHVFRNAKDTREIWPSLMDKLSCSATYYDAWISYPERLGIELLLDVALDNPGSLALNYSTLVPSEDGFSIYDLRSATEFPITTNAIVNATGAWLDEAIGSLSLTDAPTENLVSGTKGSHLVIDNSALFSALNGNMIFFENDDGRVCIVFPYLGKVLAGSTDIRIETISKVKCEDDERDYILDSLKLVFPTVPILKEQIVFSYSGIRPLPRSDHNFTGRISRDHFVKRVEGAIPQFCMIGGKWTTFRAFAEQTAAQVLDTLGHKKIVSTVDTQIGGGKGFPSDPVKLSDALREAYGISTARAKHLVLLYGTRAHLVQNYCAEAPDDRAFLNGSQYTTGEIGFLLEHEHVASLSDLVLRRTDLAITGQISIALIESISCVAAKLRGWSIDRKTEEKNGLIADLKNYHGVSLDMLTTRNQMRNF